MAGTLVLVRHGESLWNAKNTWTGWTDIGLSPKGKEEAKAAAGKLADMHFDHAFTSTLVRAKDTLTIILDALKQPELPTTITHALDERNYGIYTGKNKLEVQRELGEEAYKQLRRGWDYPIAQGESLKQVYGRVVPYFQKVIAPVLARGNCIMVSAHGNSLRALMKYLEHISDESVSDVELKTGEIVVYALAEDGSIVHREKRLAL